LRHGGLKRENKNQGFGPRSTNNYSRGKREGGIFLRHTGLGGVVQGGLGGKNVRTT